MLHQMQCLSLSTKFNPLQHHGYFKPIVSPLTQRQGLAIGDQSNRLSIKCRSQDSLHLTNQNKYRHNEGIIRNSTHHKSSKKRHVSLAFQSEADNNRASPRFIEVVKKKLNAIGHITRYYAQIHNVVAVTSVCFLPIQSLSQVTPTFLIGVLKAAVAQVLMSIFVSSINQICDLEIDKINKPYLPLASGDLSMGTGIAICAGSAILSLALAYSTRSPAVLWAQILFGLAGAAYSVPFPFLRWKSHTFMAPFTGVILMGLILQIPYFIYSQTNLLGRPFVMTRSFIFATIIMSIYAFVNGLLKDLPDVEGDKSFGMRTLCVIFGKEKVLPLCVNTMLLSYGGAVIAGANSSLMISKLVTIIGHIILALMIWVQSRRVDLENFDSQFNFYMFLWKLNDIEYFLIHFLR